MIPHLPRELLWTDKTDIADFRFDELKNSISSMYTFAKSRITKELNTPTLLLIYNEAFYLCTRIVYERDAEARPESYMEVILSDLGSQELAEQVALLMFLILVLQSDKSATTLRFIDLWLNTYLPSFPLKIASTINKYIKPLKNKENLSLKPQPWPAKDLQKLSIQWDLITANFSKHLISEILQLWPEENNKALVTRLIEQAYKSHASSNDEMNPKRADDVFFTMLKNLYKPNEVYQLPDMSIREMMIQAVNESVRDGVWYGKPSWAVVYRVYQMKGYTDNMTQFVKEVKNWSIDVAKTITYDDVQKNTTNHHLHGPFDKWKETGAPLVAIELANTLLFKLDMKVNK